MLRRRLREAGAVDLTQRAHVIDYSSDMPAHAAFAKDWRAAFELVAPFVAAAGVIDRDTFDVLRGEMAAELAAPDFSAVMFLLTVTGRRPLPE
ncbi:MAG TPA: hypothetical protein VLW53_11870 [Candidatus Eisenbacteria bacterium]|nr:hypothetical protein [Candidatus Eisenbacteria bacterium]